MSIMRDAIALYIVIGVLYARVYCWGSIASKESEPGLVVSFLVQASMWPLCVFIDCCM